MRRQTWIRIGVVAVIVAALLAVAWIAIGTQDPYRVGPIQHSSSVGPPTPVGIVLAEYPLSDDHHYVGKLRHHHRRGDIKQGPISGPNDWYRPAWVSAYRKNPPTGIIQIRGNAHVVFHWNTLHNHITAFRFDTSCETPALIDPWHCDSPDPVRIVKGSGRVCDLYLGCWDYVYRRWYWSFSGHWCVDTICGDHHKPLWASMTIRGNGKVAFDTAPDA